MVPEVVLQLKGPELHQSQLRLTRNPAPSAILDSRGVQDPITEWEASEGGAEAAVELTWLLGPGLPATCSGSLALVELQLQLPDSTPARRQGISVHLSVGKASVGVVLPHTRAYPSPFSKTTPPQSSLGSLGCSLPQLKCGVTAGPLPNKPEPHVLGSSFPLVLQNGLRD